MRSENTNKKNVKETFRHLSTHKVTQYQNRVAKILLLFKIQNNTIIIRCQTTHQQQRGLHPRVSLCHPQH